MLNGLSRDYWPPLTKRALGRAALAFAVSPLVIVCVLLVLLVIAEMVFVGDFEIGRSRALGFGPVLLVSTYVILFSAGAVAFLALWSLRLRGRLSYLLAGMAVGLVSALAAPLFGTERPGWLPVVIFMVHFGLLMLVFRAIAGIRRIDD